jgi:hypothetical protein
MSVRSRMRKPSALQRAIGAVAAVFDSLRDEAWQAAGCRGVQWFKVQKSKTFKNL